MKIVHVNYYEHIGGASLAARRLHHGMLEDGMDSSMLVMRKNSEDETIIQSGNVLSRSYNWIAIRVAFGLLKFQRTSNFMPHSLNIFPGDTVGELERLNADIINLHWINGEMISISQLARLKGRKVVWTIHDAWPFCGSEHHSLINGKDRYKNGYLKENRENHGLDIDAMVWRYKQSCWEDIDFQIVSPSAWLARRAAESVLFRERPIHIIPNGVDTRVPVPQRAEARAKLRLPQDKILLGIGAMSLRERNKGGADLIELIEAVHRINPAVEWVVVGNGQIPSISVPIHHLGRISDCDSFFSAVEAFVSIPKVDNLPNMLIEAMRCGTPCAAFAVGGIPEIIDHRINGVLAAPDDYTGLVEEIGWLLNRENRERLSSAARRKVADRFDIRQTVNCYLDLYRSMC